MLFATGTTRTSTTNWDIVTLRYNLATCDISWSQSYTGSADNFDFPTAITTDSAGGVYVTGYVWNPTRDMFALKYNASGVQQWASTYNGLNNGGDYSNCIAVDAAGNVYIAGRSDSAGYQRLTLVKFGSGGGSPQWVRLFAAVDSSRYDEALAVKVDASGNVYVAGFSYMRSTPGFEDWVVLKYNSSGALQWARTYNGSAGGSDKARFLVLSPAADVYVFGYTTQTGTNKDLHIRKYNGSTGAVMDSAFYVGPGTAQDDAGGMTIDAAGNVYVVGTSGPNYVTLKYNSSLQQQWFARTTNSGQVYATGIAVGTAGDVNVTGWILNGDWYTVRYNSSGVYQYQYSMGGSAGLPDYCYGIVEDAQANLYTIGSMAFSDGQGTDFTMVSYPPVGIKPISSEVPSAYSLSQNYPNPFNPITSFEFAIPKKSFVAVKVYDILGSEIAELFSGNLGPGKYQATWNAAGFASGVYFYRITAGDFSAARKMILSK